MRFCVVIVITITCSVLSEAKLIEQPGYCEPLTVEYIASLINKKAREVIDPSLRLNHKKLRYDLYTRRNPYDRQVLYPGDLARLQKSNFNAQWPVRFSIHGWNGMSTTCTNAAIKDAYLARGDFNVIIVDWSDYALDVNYIGVLLHMHEIAAKFNEFARFLHKVKKIPYEQMYLIGHSAGCHIAGFAGKLLKPHTYGVIYALEPSGPIHRLLNDNWHLTPNDALYVEAIQSDLALFGFRSGNLGHSSFYPNWGLGQPHCPNGTTMVPDFTCDHFGSLYYFAESIRNPKAFGAIRCKSYESVVKQKCNCGSQRNCPAQVFMGGEPARPKRGIYYFSTHSKKPYGYGEICRIKRPRQPTITKL